MSNSSKSLACSLGLAFLRTGEAAALLPRATGQDGRVLQTFLHALDLWSVCDARQRYAVLRILGALAYLMPQELRPLLHAALGRVDTSETARELMWGRMLSNALESAVCSSPSWLCHRPQLHDLERLEGADLALFRAGLHLLDELAPTDAPRAVIALRGIVGQMSEGARVLFGAAVPYFSTQGARLWKEVAA